MGTIVAVIKEGKASIGADDLQVSWGFRRQTPEDVIGVPTIQKVNGSYVGISGDASIIQAIQHYFGSKDNVDLKGHESIFHEWIALHQELKERYFLLNDQNDDLSFESSRFEALILNSEGIFRTYERRSIQRFARFAAIGTGAEYSLGSLEILYDEKISAEGLVRRALEVASHFDVETGRCGPIYEIEVT